MQSSAASIPDRFLHRARFGDHDELSSLIRGGQTEFIQMAPGAFKGEFTSLFLENATIQFGEVGLPYTCRGAASGNRLMFVLNVRPQPDLVWKGQVLDPRAIMFLPPHAEHHDITPANSYWALVAVEDARLQRMLASLNGGEPMLDLKTSRVLLPRAGPFEVLRHRLKTVHAALRSDRSFLAVPEARHSMEEMVLSALVQALSSGARVRPNGYGAAHARVVRQVEAYLSTHLDEGLYVGDLCAVAGVGERTLRNIFQERYRMSPVRYLKLRRLHQARRALRRADSDLNTVQAVANRCGIWHLGRFAHEYRALFNEAPLETLKKVCPIGRQETLPATPQVRHPGASPIPGLG